MEPFNSQDQPGDVHDALVSQLLMSTGTISLIVDGMFTGAGNGRLPSEVAVAASAQELFAAILAEHLRRSDDEIGTAAAVIGDALAALCEHMYPIDRVAWGCEGRRRPPRLNAG